MWHAPHWRSVTTPLFDPNKGKAIEFVRFLSND